MKGYKEATAVLCIILMTTGCGSGGGNRAEAADSIKNETVQDSQKTYDDSLIKETATRDLRFTDEYGSTFEYRYHMPQIDSDKPAAKQINLDIQTRFAQRIEEAVNDITVNKTYPMLMDVTWKSHWSGSLLSLEINANGDIPFADDVIYCYDFEKDEILENAEVLKRAGVTEEQFFKAAQRSAAKKFDEGYAEFAVDEFNLGLYYDSILQYRQNSISVENLREAKIFMDGKDLMMRSKYLSPAGYGYMFAVSRVPLEKPNLPPKKVVKEFLTAEIRDGEVYLTIADTPDSNVYLFGSQYELQGKTLEFGKEYMVKGAYSDYKDIYVGVIGQDFYPYIILTTTEGTYEMIDVMQGAAYGEFYAAPMPGTKGAGGLKEELVTEEGVDAEYGGYNTITAMLHMGIKADLIDWVIGLNYAFPPDFTGYDVQRKWTSEDIIHNVDSGGSYTGRYELTFSEDGQMTYSEYLPDVGIYVNYNGFARCIGMTDEGLVYSYSFYPVEGETWCNGTFIVKQDLTQYNDGYSDMYIKAVSGTELFDSPEKWIKFTV